MKKLASIILASTILLVGCSNNDNIESLENAIQTSRDLISEKKFEQARGALEYVRKYGGSNLEEYSNLSGQLDQLILATEKYEEKKYKECNVILDQLIAKDKNDNTILKSAVELQKEISKVLLEEDMNNIVEVDNNTISQPISWDNIDASSYLIQKSRYYNPENAIDNDTSTAWIEDLEGDGIGEFIQFSSENTFKVDKIDIINGFTKSQDLYIKNNRVKKVTLEFSDGTKQVHKLRDNNMDYQTIDVGGVNTNSVKVIIDEVYKGSKYSDTCISEISIYGK